MTDVTDQLDAIQARADAITPGPWRTWKDDGGRRGSAVETAWAHDADGADTELITDWCSPADAEFIAASPDDIAFLLDLARKQQAALDAVKALHAPVSIYECDDNGFAQSEDESKHVRDICGTCSDSSVTENLDDGNYDLAGEWGEVGWPCPTIAALEAKP
jgi:hypothetical protein